MRPIFQCGIAAVLGLAQLAAFAAAGCAADLVSLYSFCTAVNQNFQCLDGEAPWSRLLQIDGSLYGTTSGGHGTVFRITKRGKFTSLYVFCKDRNCRAGAAPGKYLARGPDDEIYGVTTQDGGSGDGGTIFRISPGGGLTIFYRFCSQANCLDGSAPTAVTFDPSGNLFGTSTQGGKYREGTLFEITAGGVYRKLHDFCSRPDCADGLSAGALLRAKDGDFYGTTAAGGEDQGGSVFRMRPDGSLTTLYSFCSVVNCPDGEQPTPLLVEGRNGDFYGTTMLGGANGAGTIFRLTPSGSLKTLYAFCGRAYCDDGANPQDGLVAAPDGSFYGTASTGGIYYNGVLFNITASKKYSIVYNFCATAGCFDGSTPSAAPTLDKNGNLYGTTLAGGDKSNVGAIYELSP